MQAQLLVLVVTCYDLPMKHMAQGGCVPTTMSEESLGWILMLMRPTLGASRYVPEAMKALQALSELPAIYTQFTLGLD